MLDLPALGKPTRPASASERSSRVRRRWRPGSPFSWKPAIRRPGPERAALPRPPRPPLAARNLTPGLSRSASSSPSVSRTRVPTGTGRVRSSPSAPLRLFPCPWAPRVARWWGWKWYSTRVPTPGSATSMTSPPRPPSPPSGPPRGLYFSRWNEVTPSPPRPAVTSMVVSSTNTARGPAGRVAGGRLGARVDAGQLAAAHHVVDDRAVDLGEQGVVAAAADALARVDAGATLADQDRARGHQLAAVALDPEPLGGRVAAVAAGGCALLVRHLSLPLPACPAAPAWPCWFGRPACGCRGRWSRP